VSGYTNTSSHSTRWLWYTVVNNQWTRKSNNKGWTGKVRFRSRKLLLRHGPSTSYDANVCSLRGVGAPNGLSTAVYFKHGTKRNVPIQGIPGMQLGHSRADRNCWNQLTMECTEQGLTIMQCVSNLNTRHLRACLAATDLPYRHNIKTKHKCNVLTGPYTSALIQFQDCPDILLRPRFCLRKPFDFPTHAEICLRQ
jgi:hypothetical protein